MKTNQAIIQFNLEVHKGKHGKEKGFQECRNFPLL